jgi:hypothetical protein
MDHDQMTEQLEGPLDSAEPAKPAPEPLVVIQLKAVGSWMRENKAATASGIVAISSFVIFVSCTPVCDSGTEKTVSSPQRSGDGSSDCHCWVFESRLS